METDRIVRAVGSDGGSGGSPLSGLHSNQQECAGNVLGAPAAKDYSHLTGGGDSASDSGGVQISVGGRTPDATPPPLENTAPEFDFTSSQQVRV